MDRTLLTERLTLRPPRRSDAAWAFARWAGQPERLSHLGWSPHLSRSQTEAQLAWDEVRWTKHSAWTWLLCAPVLDPGPIGLVQLLPQRLDGPAHHLRLGYVLGRTWEAQGLMREAVAAVTAHALVQPEVWRVDALVSVDNPRSSHLLDALGWRREGRLARALAGSSAEPVDAWLWACTRTATIGP